MNDPLPIGIKEGVFDGGNTMAIAPEVRRKHMAVFGATGAGKSTLLRNMIAWDIASGVGVTVVDPHGGLVDDILDNHIPRHRINDVIYFNPKEPERVLSINVLECSQPAQRGLVISNVISIFHRLWHDSWGPRMEDILRNSLYVLIEQKKPYSLLALPRLLTDPSFRNASLKQVSNPAVLDFFLNTFDRWTTNFRQEAISPVLNKCRAFLTDPLSRAVVGPSHSSFDFRWMMDSQKILLCDLSKGSIGEDNSQLLGSLIIVQEKLAALSRHDVPENHRVQHVLYTEEAQNFIGDFPAILQEARKYRLTLVLATQGVEQLSKDAAFAVFTNCATLVSFRVSNYDALRLKGELSMAFPASILQDLPDYKMYVRTLSQSGNAASPSGPHLVAPYPPFPKQALNAAREEIIKTSFDRYTTARSSVNAKLSRFMLDRDAG